MAVVGGLVGCADREHDADGLGVVGEDGAGSDGETTGGVATSQTTYGPSGQTADEGTQTDSASDDTTSWSEGSTYAGPDWDTDGDTDGTAGTGGTTSGTTGSTAG